MLLIGRAAGRGAFKAAALVGAFAIIVATWWWDASLLTAAADANLQLIKIVTSKLPFDWGSKVESALRIFGADRALLLIEGVAIAKVVMLGFAYPSSPARGFLFLPGLDPRIMVQKALAEEPYPAGTARGSAAVDFSGVSRTATAATSAASAANPASA